MKNLKKCALALIMVTAFAMVVPNNVQAASKLKKTKVTIAVGKSYTLKTTSKVKKVTWKISKKSVAKISKKKAKSVKITAVKKGKAVVSVKIGKKTYKCKVTVVDPKISMKSINLNVDSSTILKVTGGTGAIKWSTSNNSIATVNSSGKVTGKKAGTTTVTATVNGKVLSCKVTVERKSESSTKLYMVTDKASAKVGQTVQLEVSTNSDSTIRWSSSNSSIATVTTSGLVTARSVGTATITATQDGVSVSCVVTVSASTSSGGTSGGTSGGSTGSTETPRETEKETEGVNNDYGMKGTGSIQVDDEGISKSGKYVYNISGGASLVFYNIPNGVTIVRAVGEVDGVAKAIFSGYENDAYNENSMSIKGLKVGSTEMTFYFSNGQTFKCKVNVLSSDTKYINYYNTDIKDCLNRLSDNMTTEEKVKKILWFCNQKYSYCFNHYYLGEYDCIRSSNLLVDICREIGVEAYIVKDYRVDDHTVAKVYINGTPYRVNAQPTGASMGNNNLWGGWQEPIYAKDFQVWAGN